MSRTTWIVAGGLVAVGAVTLTAALGLRGIAGEDGADGGVDARASAGTATAPVRRTTLVATTDVDGTLGYPEPSGVRGPAGVLTAVPGVGSVRERGEALFRVNDDPVVLLYGALPAYRTLAEGSEGRDVAQLERNLRELGYHGFDVDREFTWYTAEAVREWQRDLGMAETGEVEPDSIAYAEGRVRIARVHHARGSVVGNDPVISYDRGERRVTAELEPTEQRLAEVGAEVEVELPSSETVGGTITAAETVTSDGSGESGGSSGSGSGSGGSGDQTTIELTIELDRSDAAGELDTAPVVVTLRSAERADVLAVPVTALLALPAGGYGVRVVDDSSDPAGSGGQPVAVELGLFADGLVEVESEELTEGMTVEVPSR